MPARCLGHIRTTSLRDTGALSDSAISCAFSLMLALRVRTVRIASLKLFCLPCLPPPGVPFAHALQLCAPDFFLAGHRSLECSPLGNPTGSGFGVWSLDGGVMTSSRRSSMYRSGWRSGNLNLPLGFADEERRRSAMVALGAMVVACTGG